MSPALVQITYAIIGNLTGFDLHGTSPARILEFVRRRAELLHYSSPALYLEDLKAASPMDAEPQRLINLVTNGVTCFWRDEPQLEALRAALRELKQRDLGRPIRVWCAGCSTGDEAYTVAMVADEEGALVDVLGTDINTEVLSHAALGRYDAWSLRRLDPARREAYFEQVSDGQWDIATRLFDVVEFDQHNMLQPLRGRPVCDVIMCRNVLIYFSTIAKRMAAENFAASLDVDGYLILGSSEQLQDDWHLWRASRQADGFVFRHSQKSAGTTMAIVVDDLDGEISIPFDEVPSSVEEETVDFDDQDTVVEFLERAQYHRDRSELELALACYEAASGYDPFVPETYILTGWLLEEQVAPIRAQEAYRKALFLDPYEWFAAFRLAQVLRRGGDVRRAQQAYRQALEGIRERPDWAREASFRSLRFPEEMRDIERLRQICSEALEDLDS